MNLDPPIPSSQVTLDRLDPLSAAAARPVTTGASLLALALPLLTVVTRGAEITQPLWFAVSYTALVAATALLLYRSRASKPAWLSPSAQWFQVLLMIVLVTSAASTLGANQLVRDDWAPLVVGVLLVASTPYRPAREIVFWTIVHTLLCSALGVVQAPASVTDVPVFTLAVTGSFSVAVMGFAAAAYARSLNSSTQLWHERAWQSAASAALEHRSGVARSVQQQRISLLNREVVPYLQRVVAADGIGDDDRDEARRLARSIRALLVSDVEKTWAQLMLDDLVARHPRLNIAAIADDPDDLGRHAVLERRTLLRALAALSLDRLSATRLELTLRRAPEGGLAVRWAVDTPKPLPDARRELRAMLELVRGLTLRSSVHEQPGRLVLEFDYGY
ncbi:hypothetical protein [Microcella sp.]|uniref:hypothetical protein n=1 Tax=Microcella sp. TaxID=1913979 RepID=UPI00391D2738